MGYEIVYTTGMNPRRLDDCGTMHLSPNIIFLAIRSCTQLLLTRANHNLNPKPSLTTATVEVEEELGDRHCHIPSVHKGTMLTCT